MQNYHKEMKIMEQVKYKFFGRMAILLFIFIVLLIFVLSNLFSLKWPANAIVTKLTPTLPVLDEKQVKNDNGYFYLRQLAKYNPCFPSSKPVLIKFSCKQYSKEMEEFRALGYSSQKYPTLDHALSEYNDALLLLNKVAGCPYSQVAQPSINANYEYLVPLQQLTSLLCYKIEKDAKELDWEPMLEEIKTVLKISNQCSRGGSLTHLSTSNQLQEFICDTLQRVVVENKIPEFIAKLIIDELLQTADDKTLLAEAMRYELQLINETIAVAYGKTDSVNADEKVVSAKYYLPILYLFGSSCNKTQSNINKIFSNIIANAEKTYSLKSLQNNLATKFMRECKKHPIRAKIGRDPVGKKIFCNISQVLTSKEINQNYYKSIASLRMTAILCAVRSYELAHGGFYPDSMDLLSPRYLKEIPVDPFSSQNAKLKYTIEGVSWVIYSIGYDQENNGGNFKNLKIYDLAINFYKFEGLRYTYKKNKQINSSPR